MENSGLNLLSLIRYARCTDPSSVAVFLLLSYLPPFQVQPSSVTNSDLAKLQRSALQYGIRQRKSEDQVSSAGQLLPLYPDRRTLIRSRSRQPKSDQDSSPRRHEFVEQKPDAGIQRVRLQMSLDRARPTNGDSKGSGDGNGFHGNTNPTTKLEPLGNGFGDLGGAGTDPKRMGR